MKCRLCLEEKELQKKSHIIPEFMYQELFDENHQLYKIPLDNPLKVSKIFTGEYDQFILCYQCDRKVIGQYEDYAAKALYEGVSGLEVINKEDPNEGMVTSYISNIDYTKFKLFLLSILWRADVSKRTVFQETKLGPYHEIIRLMILEGIPGEPNYLPCTMLGFGRDVEWTHQFIAYPKKIKSHSCTIYHFFISGILYSFHVGKKIGIPIPFLNGVINKSNEMKIFHVPKGEGENILKKLYWPSKTKRIG